MSDHDHVTSDDVVRTAQRLGAEPATAARTLRGGAHGHDADIEEATADLRGEPQPPRGRDTVPALRRDQANAATRSPLREIAERLEAVDALDIPGGVMARVADRVLRPAALRDALGGTWLGHAVHPLLVDFPLGMWIGTSVLDLFGGADSRGAADRLLLGGIVASLPATLAGLRDWRGTDRAAQRVGVVHAMSNSTGLALYTTSLLARRRGHRRRGVLLALGGGVMANVGGYLGGHLSLAMGVTAPEGVVPEAG
jgi:uncharacterized membrane protein